MLSRIFDHLRRNTVGYLALFAALGGTSYAAVKLAPGSVTTQALANGAVTNAKLAHSSVGSANLRKHSLTAADFKAGVLALNGGRRGSRGPAGPAGAKGAAGKDGSASVVMAARETGNVTAPHGAATDVPLADASWTQGGNDVNLLMGSMQIGIPSSCTGSFGNSLVLSVDGIPNTFALAPTVPASTTVTVPFVVSEVMEPGSTAQHLVTAKLMNTCTKSGEDYSVSNVKVDAVNFH
jgi:hypothetical protein